MISERIAKMIDPKGFDELFEDELSNYDTYQETFRALNSEFEDVFGKKRYKNYESYRQSRNQRINTLSEN